MICFIYHKIFMGIFLSALLFLFPLIAICLGFAWRNSGPSGINNVWGYRTKLSMASQDTWNFAHKYFGKIMRLYGIIMLLLTLIYLPFFMKNNTNNMSNLLILVLCIQFVLFIICFIRTEHILQVKFIKDGKLKSIS